MAKSSVSTIWINNNASSPVKTHGCSSLPTLYGSGARRKRVNRHSPFIYGYMTRGTASNGMRIINRDLWAHQRVSTEFNFDRTTLWALTVEQQHGSKQKAGYCILFKL
jgi:hypothetical protein